MKTKFLRVILFFSVIIIIPVFTLFGEKETVSYNENKVLAEFPDFSFSGYKSRSFMNGVSDFFSDHFVLREGFIKLKNSIDKVIGKTEINGVIEFDGYLIQTFRDVDYKLTDRNLSAINKLKSKNPDSNFHFMPIITAQEYFKDSIPSFLDVESESEYIGYCFDKLNGINTIDVSDAVTENEYAFYRTDHHWTTQSAYSAYTKLCSHLGIEPLDIGKFKTEEITDEFKGTLYSKTLNENIAADSITAYYSDSEYSLKIKDEVYDSLYFENFLTEKDKYSFFLGGNHGICTVTNKNITNGKKMLVIKDSYANCFVPFIAEHYSEITIVDPRYCSHTQIREINVVNYADVLILFNVSGFSQEQNFALIEFMGGK